MEDLMASLGNLQSKNQQTFIMTSSEPSQISQTSKIIRRSGTRTSAVKQTGNLDETLLGNGSMSASGQQNFQSIRQERSMAENVRASHITRPSPTQKPSKKFKVGHQLPRWGKNLPQDFFERLRLWEEESKQHKEELNERTLKDIKESLEKKLAGQYKLSKHEEQMYEALKDVSLPALFMPFKSGNVYNPRAHQYFQPTGATNVRLTQVPSVFQLPPLPRAKLSVVNLFELSKNFHAQGPTWLLQSYTERSQAVEEDHLPSTEIVSSLPQIAKIEQDYISENLSSRKSVVAESEVES